MTDDALVRFTAHELPREDLHALMARSDGSALLRTVWHFGALVITGSLLWRLRSTPWVLPLLVAHGYVLAFVFCALHETAHRTAFRTRGLNAAVGTLAGLLTVWPYRNYRVYHWEHHRYTQDPERDPELFFAKPASRPAYLFVLTGIPNALRRIGDILRLAAGRADRPWMAPAERRPLIVEARVYLGVYVALVIASVLAGSWIALLVWIAPWVIGQVFLRPYLLAEHHGLRLHAGLSREHPHHAHADARAPLRVEHAVPRRAPCLSGGALPCAAPPSPPRAGPDREPRARLRRGHREGEPPPLRAGRWHSAAPGLTMPRFPACEPAS